MEDQADVIGAADVEVVGEDSPKKIRSDTGRVEHLGQGELRLQDTARSGSRAALSPGLSTR